MQMGVAMDKESEELLVPDEQVQDCTMVALQAAHRLNNIVTVILANTDALLSAHGPDTEVGQCATEIHEAAVRATALSAEIFNAVRRRP